jgi:membrane protease subunit HflC
MNRLIAGGVFVLVVAYLIFSSIYIVHVREQALVLRFGKIVDEKTVPGLYLKLPTSLVDSVQIIDSRLLRYDLSNLELQVSDGAKYVVNAFLTYQVKDPIKFRERLQGDLGLAEQSIRTRLDSALRTIYGNHAFTAALSAERTAMMRDVRDQIAPQMVELGIDVTDVRILSTDLPDDVSKSTFERMSAERFAQAAAIRADGTQAAASIRAIAGRQSIELVAAANKDSEILRGEGDAQRAAIYSQAYGADPEFFEFYRALQSYRSALSSSGTTMVLSPDSEFFQYFKADTLDGKVPTPATPAGIPMPPSTELTVPEPPDVLPPLNVGAPTDSSGAPIPVVPAVPETSSAASSQAQ